MPRSGALIFYVLDELLATKNTLSIWIGTGKKMKFYLYSLTTKFLDGLISN